MFIAHWGLSRSPFGGGLHPADYHASPTHEEALARMMYLIDNGRRLGFLLGQSGIGKSLLLAVAAGQLRPSGCQVVSLNLTGLDASELTWRLANALGHLCTPAAGPVDWWRGIADRLAAGRYQQISTVILLDDAGHCSRDLDDTISRLALTDQHPGTRLTILLASQQDQAAHFAAKLKDLCELSIVIEPWSEEETAAYVRDTLARVGGREPIFAAEALRRLYELTDGIPRRVRQLAEVCLVAGAADHAPQIGPQIIQSIHSGLAQQTPVEVAPGSGF